MKLLKKLTGQKTSEIVTPNGVTVKYDEHGVIEKNTVSNQINEDYKKALMRLFGGN